MPQKTKAKKLYIPEDPFYKKTTSDEVTELTKNESYIMRQMSVAVNKCSTLQEFQGLINAYDKNCNFICSMIVPVVGEMVDTYLEAALKKFDFIYGTLLTDDKEGFAAKINEVGREYCRSSFGVYFAAYKEDKDLLKEMYKLQNKKFTELLSTFINVRLETSGLKTEENKDLEE